MSESAHGMGRMTSGANLLRRIPRLVVFVSGAGTNLQALIDAIHSGNLRANIELVVSNRKAVHGLVRAQQAGIPSLYAPLKAFLDGGGTREAYDAYLAAQVGIYRPDLLVLAGWKHIFSPAFLDQFPRRVINLHPALPGMFPGQNAIEQAFLAYQQGAISYSGCMVHYAIAEVDAGPVIAQTRVPFLPGDTLQSFAARMHAAEHRLLVQAVKDLVDDWG